MLVTYQQSSNIYAGIYSLYQVWGGYIGYRATSWSDPPTGPTSKSFDNTKILENNGFWGVQNAKKSAFRNYTWVGS